jgi:hypothetical protein
MLWQITWANREKLVKAKISDYDIAVLQNNMQQIKKHLMAAHSLCKKHDYTADWASVIAEAYEQIHDESERSRIVAMYEELHDQDETDHDNDNW